MSCSSVEALPELGQPVAHAGRFLEALAVDQFPQHPLQSHDLVAQGVALRVPACG